MPNKSFWIAGEIAEWPTKRRMASILRGAGLDIDVGDYAIQVKDCSHFVFEEYGGDLGEPQIDADAGTLEDVLRDAALVSKAFADVGLKHRFEVYEGGQHKLAAYLHYCWPIRIEDENATSD